MIESFFFSFVGSEFWLIRSRRWKIGILSFITLISISKRRYWHLISSFTFVLISYLPFSFLSCESADAEWLAALIYPLAHPVFLLLLILLYSEITAEGRRITKLDQILLNGNNIAIVSAWHRNLSIRCHEYEWLFVVE